MPKTLEELNREAERKEYAARCQEVDSLSRRLRDQGRAYEERIAQLIYEAGRARDLQTQTEARFCEVLAEREALTARVEWLTDNERVNANA